MQPEYIAYLALALAPATIACLLWFQFKWTFRQQAAFAAKTDDMSDEEFCSALGVEGETTFFVLELRKSFASDCGLLATKVHPEHSIKKLNDLTLAGFDIVMLLDNIGDALDLTFSDDDLDKIWKKVPEWDKKPNDKSSWRLPKPWPNVGEYFVAAATALEEQLAPYRSDEATPS